MKVILLLLLVVVLALAQTPSKPTWPRRWSASVRVVGWDHLHTRDHFFRWFYDAAENKDRIDGLGYFQDELYFAARIFDHAKDRRYEVYYQQETVVCFTRPINGSLPKPTFDDARYIGKAIDDYVPVYHWIETSRDSRFTFQYYDTQDTRKPLRMYFADNRDRRAVTFYFHEFDTCNQDPNIFVIPAEILAQCNAIPKL